MKQISCVSTASGGWPASHSAIPICVNAQAELFGAVPRISAGKRRAENRLRSLDICRFIRLLKCLLIKLLFYVVKIFK